jgi:threonine synthase
MTYLSTRGASPEATFAEALLRGIAPDGGLYLPKTWPTLSAEQIRAAAGRPYVDLARDTLAAYAGDSLSAPAIQAAVKRLSDTFTHQAITPLVQLEPNLWVLELFHGPTAAFKDLAMQMMAPLSDAALAQKNERLLLLTATSGDTGAAAVRAFAGAERVNLVVFHPLDRVSPVQRRQMTTTDAPNVLNLAVRGDFDDCQRLVKALLADDSLRDGSRLSSVNSINWGRLVGQIPYYIAAASALAHRTAARASWCRPATSATPSPAGPRAAWACRWS